MKNFFANNFQFHSNTEDLGIAVTRDYQGFDSPEVRFSSYDKPGQKGSVVTNQLDGGRTLHIPGRVASKDIPTYYQLRRTLQNAFRIVKDSSGKSIPVLLKFQTMDNLYLQTLVYAKSKPQFINRSEEMCNFILELFAPDPNLYDQSTTTISINLPTFTGLVYPVIYPVIYPAGSGGMAIATNAGDANTPLKITFYGPMTSPFIENLTTGDSFSINATLNLGDKLVVDPVSHTMVLNDTQNALGDFVLSNTWMELIPGDNVLGIGSGLSSDSGYVLAEFNSAYEGI